MAGMRRKTIVSRARIRVSPQPSDSEDIDGGSGFEGDDGTRHQSPEAHERGNHGGDGIREKSPTVGNNEAGNSVDRLKTGACIACDGEDNQVLVCNETGCPVSIHRSCMPDEPDFDELGDFYCPYCWYKRLVVKPLKLQEEVTATEKRMKARDISVGVDVAVTVDGNGGRTRNAIEGDMSSGRRMKNLNPCENIGKDGESGHRRVELETRQQNQTVSAEIQEPDASNNDERAQGQDSDVVEGRKRCRRSSDGQERAEERYGDQSRGAVNEEREHGADVSKDCEVVKERVNGSRKGEKAEPDLSPSISSPRSTKSVDESDTSDQEFALVMRPKGNVQEQQSNKERHHRCSDASSKKPLFEPEKFSVGNKSYQKKTAIERHDPKQRKDNAHYDRKRKRLFWTPEEEDMLRVAVEKFSRTVNKNMPWRKLLEFGGDVFQEGRTPSDLKDKWKMLNKCQ